LIGDFIELGRLFVVDHTKRPGHDKLQKSKDPSPCDTAVKGVVQDVRIGSQNRQSEIEAEKEDCERNNESFLGSNQLSKLIRFRDG